MYKVNILNTASHVEVSSHTSTDSMFCCIVEAHHEAPNWHPAGFFKNLLWDAQAAQKNLLRSANPPYELADSINRIIQQWADEGTAKEAVLYCGLALYPTHVQLCWAGDIRVHLIENGQLSQVNKLHNLDYSPATLINCLCFDRPNVAETATWQVSGEHTVVICTSQFHQWRKPEEYLSQISEDPLSARLEGGFKSHGAIIKIDYLRL